MKRFKKNIFLTGTAALALLFGFVVAGCGDGDDYGTVPRELRGTWTTTATEKVKSLTFTETALTFTPVGGTSWNPAQTCPVQSVTDAGDGKKLVYAANSVNKGTFEYKIGEDGTLAISGTDDGPFSGFSSSYSK